MLRKRKEERERERKEYENKIEQDAIERNERYKREYEERKAKKLEEKNGRLINIIIKEPDKRINHRVPSNNNNINNCSNSLSSQNKNHISNPFTWTSCNITHGTVNPSPMPVPIPSIEERKKNLNQLYNNIFNEQSLIQSNCFYTSGFDENAFNDYTKTIHFENGKRGVRLIIVIKTMVVFLYS